MKTSVMLVMLAVVAADIKFYKTGNDHYDMDALIANVTEMQAYANCYNDKGPCTELATSYKNILAEAFVQACQRCNPSQKYQFRRWLEGLKQVLPNDYNLFIKKYDPENKYLEALEKEISKYTIATATK